MASKYEKMNLLKNLPFYSEEIKKPEKKDKKISNIELISELPFFSKKHKELTNRELSEALPFFPEKTKRKWSKRLTKCQVLQNILPFYESAGIFRREYAHRGAAETYNVEVVDSKSLGDSLFLAKSSINDLFRDLLKEKGGFKYNLKTSVTLKRWNNATNSYDIIIRHFRITDPITVINQRFDLYEELKHKLGIWTSEGSGWIIDNIEAILIDTSNYDQLAGSSYIQLPPKLSNSMKGLISIKNEDNECFKLCHIRFINPQDKHPKRIKKQDKEIAETLDYRGINFPVKARNYEIIEERLNINVNAFGYGNRKIKWTSIKCIINKKWNWWFALRFNQRF